MGRFPCMVGCLHSGCIMPTRASVPFPYKISAADRAAAKDLVPEATEEEMALLVNVVDSEILTADAMMEALPWTMAEELF